MSTMTLDGVSEDLRRLGYNGYANVIDAHLREREAAKAGMTEDLAIEAGKAIAARFSEGFFDQRMVMECGRAALEAVAPTLASARVPDAMEVDGSPFQTWDHDTYKEYGYALGWNACRSAMLAAAPKPETEE